MHRIEKKKLISILFIILILANNFLPIMVFAEDNTAGNSTTEEVSTNYEIKKDEEEWDISKNGDGKVKAKWKLEDKSLTITGSGEMKDWDTSSTEDWHSNKFTRLIKKVTISNGIKNIGYAAFYKCINIESIDIPESITSIGGYAFCECEKLTTVYIPETLTSIGDSAFEKCSRITNISIPNSVTNIGKSTFYGCSSLTNIHIPDSVTSIKYATFWACSNLINITIPNKVTSIGSYAFRDCDNLVNIDMSDSVTKIDSDAFFDCTSITSITIPKNVSIIGIGTFDGCTNLQSINVDEDNNDYASENGILYNKNKTTLVCYPEGKVETSYIIPNSVTTIENHAFYYTFYNSNNLKLNNLKNIMIPDSVTKIAYEAFLNFYGIINCKTNSEAHKFAEEHKIRYILEDNKDTSISSKYQIKREEDWDISKNGDGKIKAKWKLEDRSLTIAGSGEMIDWTSDLKEKSNFKKYVDVIEKVTIEKGLTNIGSYTFSGFSNINSIQIPNSVKSIGNNAFYGCTNLNSIVIPNSVKSIGDYAFMECSSFQNIVIPSSVTSIGMGAFEDCINLESIQISSGVTSIPYYLFGRCSSLKNVTIPNSITTIDSFAFIDCIALENIEIPSSVTKINQEPFRNCTNLKSITVNSNNKQFSSKNGILYNKNKTELIRYPSKKARYLI